MWKVIRINGNRKVSAFAPKGFGLEFSTLEFTETEKRMAELGYYIYVFTTQDEAVIWKYNIGIYGFRTQLWTVECLEEQYLKPPVPPRLLYGQENTFKVISEFNAVGSLLPYFTKMFNKVRLQEFVSD